MAAATKKRAAKGGKARTKAKAQPEVEPAKAQAAVETPAKATSEHPKARREVLKRAGLSMGSELTPEQVERADSPEAEKVPARSLAAFIMRGSGGSNGGGNGASRRSQPEGKLSAREAAVKVLKAAKGPLTAKEAAERLLKIEPAPISGKYAMANAQKAFYSLVKAGEAKRDKDGKISAAG